MPSAWEGLNVQNPTSWAWGFEILAFLQESFTEPLQEYFPGFLPKVSGISHSRFPEWLVNGLSRDFCEISADIHPEIYPEFFAISLGVTLGFSLTGL